MGFTKNKAWSIVIALIALILLNVVAFILPVYHGIHFWMGYSFAIFSNLVLAITAIITLNKPNVNKTFLGLPALSVAWIYFAVQTALSVWQMANFDFLYYTGIIINATLAALAIITLITADMAIKEIEKVEEKIAEKVFFVKGLKTDIELLETDNLEVSAKLKDLEEVVRFSDPMSHSRLASIENEIVNKFKVLKDNMSNSSTALKLCNEMQRLLTERNQKCKLLKGIPEPAPEKDNSGAKYVATALGVVSIIVLVLLIVSFVIIPANKYNNAVLLLDNEKYEEAIVVFEELGNYRDSVSKTEIAKEKICEEKYLLAEEYYENQCYIESIRLYEELGDYKDSKVKIEHIYNMFAVDDEIYFGEYKGKPISWKILKTEKSRMLLITQSPIEQLAFNNELKNITWETSSIREWLNEKFLQNFSEEQRNRMLRETTNDINDEIFLLSQEEYNAYAVNISLETDSDWWLRTKTDSGMMYVYGETGDVNTIGEGVVRAMGIRPCVWISLY